MAKPKPASLSRTIGAKPYSMIELNQMVLESRRKAKRRAKRLPLATAVECDPKTGVSITMEDGCRVFIPLAEFHELRGATHSELRDVVLRIQGHSIEWPQLDMRFDICERLADLFGMRAIMAETFAGQSEQTESRAQSASARANGLKRGRPRKPVAAG